MIPLVLRAHKSQHAYSALPLTNRALFRLPASLDERVTTAFRAPAIARSMLLARQTQGNATLANVVVYLGQAVEKMQADGGQEARYLRRQRRQRRLSVSLGREVLAQGMLWSVLARPVDVGANLTRLGIGSASAVYEEDAGALVQAIIVPPPTERTGWQHLKLNHGFTVTVGGRFWHCGPSNVSVNTLGPRQLNVVQV